MLHTIFTWMAITGTVVLLIAVVGGGLWVWSANGQHYGGMMQLFISACVAAAGLAMIIVGMIGKFFT